jgi:hypothetical protein
MAKLVPHGKFFDMNANSYSRLSLFKTNVAPSLNAGFPKTQGFSPKTHQPRVFGGFLGFWVDGLMGFCYTIYIHALHPVILKF